MSPAIPALSFRNVTEYTVFSPKSSELPSSCPGRGAASSGTRQQELERERVRLGAGARARQLLS